MSDWAAFCSCESEGLVRRAVDALDPDARLTVARSGDALRRMSLVSYPGELGIVVGPVSEGVSDVNLAAAIANSGNVRCVVLVCESATGSLRSRAARAGIDRVMVHAELRDEMPRPPEASPAGIACPPQAGPTDPSDGDKGRVIVFCSGRGGVGKTTLGSCAAMIAARWGLRTCLLDLDLSCGNASAGFGVSSSSDLSVFARAGFSPELAARSVVSAAPGLGVMGPCGRPEMAELAAPYVNALLGWAAREFDLVVVDTSTTFTDAVAQAVQGADRLVLVTDGGPGSVSSLARMSGLAVRLGVARTRIARVENRADPRTRTDPTVGRAEVGLEAARVYRVVDGGGEVPELVSAGRVRELCEPGYPFADSVSALLAQLLAELGALPESDEARRAYESRGPRRRWALFGRRGEAR